MIDKGALLQKDANTSFPSHSQSDDSDDGPKYQEPGEANAATHSVAMETAAAAE